MNNYLFNKNFGLISTTQTCYVTGNVIDIPAHHSLTLIGQCSVVITANGSPELA